MAVFKAIRNKKQTVGTMKGAMLYIIDSRKTVYHGDDLVSALHCTVYTSYTEMMTTKRQFRKEGGRQFYQFVQSFPADTNLTPHKVHQIGLEFAERQFPDFEVLMATHCNTENLHNHFIVNAVSFKDGRKLHQNHEDLVRHRQVNDEICMEYGEPVLESYTQENQKRTEKSGEYQAAKHGNSWKLELILAIEDALRYSTDKDSFIQNMEIEGYKVQWSDSRKHITYTCPNGKKCRDNKLHDDIYLKENMEKLFEFRAVSGFVPLTPEPEQGWLAEAEEHLSAWITLGYHVESMAEPIRTEIRIAHSDSRRRWKEVLKKLAHGQKISAEQGPGWE